VVLHIHLLKPLAVVVIIIVTLRPFTLRSIKQVIIILSSFANPIILTLLAIIIIEMQVAVIMNSSMLPVY
jgi:hypothetical protein